MWRPLAMALCPGIWPTRKGSSGKLFIATKLMVTMVDMSGGRHGGCFFFGDSSADQPRGSMLECLSIPFQMTLWVSPQSSPDFMLPSSWDHLPPG